MAKAKASVEELVGMIERGELRLPQSHPAPKNPMPVRMPCTTLPIAFGSIAKEWFGDSSTTIVATAVAELCTPAARAREDSQCDTSFAEG